MESLAFDGQFKSKGIVSIYCKAGEIIIVLSNHLKWSDWFYAFAYNYHFIYFFDIIIWS